MYSPIPPRRRRNKLTTGAFLVQVANQTSTSPVRNALSDLFSTPPIWRYFCGTRPPLQGPRHANCEFQVTDRFVQASVVDSESSSRLGIERPNIKYVMFGYRCGFFQITQRHEESAPKISGEVVGRDGQVVRPVRGAVVGPRGPSATGSRTCRPGGRRRLISFVSKGSPPCECAVLGFFLAVCRKPSQRTVACPLIAITGRPPRVFSYAAYPLRAREGVDPELLFG